MKPRLSTRWNLTPREAMRLQERLRERVVLEDRFDGVRTVAGADLAFDPATDDAVAGVIVYRFPQLEEVERRMAWRKLRFPYVPGLLSFREGPVLLAAFARLRAEPDLILIDLSLKSGSGFDVLEALQALEQKPSAIKVVLTNHASEEFKSLSFRMGANGFFDKGTETSQVLALITALASEKRRWNLPNGSRHPRWEKDSRK